MKTKIIDNVLHKDKNGKKKEISREINNLESFIKQEKSPNEMYKSNLMSLSKSKIFERCKRYRKIFVLKESLVQEEKLVY